jgi:hypothetical protein
MSEPECQAPGPLCLTSNREDLQRIDNQPYVPTAALQKLVATKRKSKLAHVKLLEPKLVGHSVSCLLPPPPPPTRYDCQSCARTPCDNGCSFGQDSCVIHPLLVSQVKDEGKYKPPSHQRALWHCQACGDMLEPSNISQIGKSHFQDGVCKKAAAVKSQAPSVDSTCPSTSGVGSKRSATEPVGPGPVSAAGEGSKQQRLFLTPPALGERAVVALSRFIFRNGTFNMIEDVDLRAAFNTLGVKLPGEEHVERSGSILLPLGCCVLTYLVVSSTTCCRAHTSCYHIVGCRV